MKTPREILLNRHASAEARLDAIRKQIVTEEVVLRAARTENNASARMRTSRVAQLFNLLSRRIVSCEASPKSEASSRADTEPIANRRYARVQPCAPWSLPLHPPAWRNPLQQFAQQVWIELIRPCRRAWCALAGAWVLILTLNAFTMETAVASKDDAARQAQSLMRFLREQNRLAAQLSEPSPSPTLPESSPLPGPRSERRPSNHKLGSPHERTC